MQVRPATRRDAHAIAATNVLAWQAIQRGHVPDRRLDQLNETIEERAIYGEEVTATKESREVVLVAEDGGEVIGFAHALPSRDPFASKGAAEIATLFVRPEHWGAGRKLLTETVKKLKQAKFSRVTFWVLDFNERARRLYELAGLNPEGSTKTSELAGIPLTEVRYTLDL